MGCLVTKVTQQKLVTTSKLNKVMGRDSDKAHVIWRQLSDDTDVLQYGFSFILVYILLNAVMIISRCRPVNA